MSPEANAILQRLRRIKPRDFSACLGMLFEKDEALEEAAEIIEDRVKSGAYVLTDDLARLLIKARRTTLYDLVKDQLFKDQWALINLYQGGYPDPTIEDELVELLYQKSEDDADPARRMISEAIFEKGTLATIPVLEAILYDLAPTQSTKNAIANALFDASGPNLEALLAGVVAKSRSEFVHTITQALEAVRERNSERSTFPVQTVNSPRKDMELVSNAHRELEQARDRLQSDPTYVLVCLRRGAEAMGKHLYRHLGHEAKGKSAGRMMLGELLKMISDSDAPQGFKICLQALQPFGNYAAHDQDDRFQYLTPPVAESLVNLFDAALTIYESWLRDR